MESFMDEMINMKLIYNKKTDQVLDSLYKNTEIDYEPHLYLSYLFESENSNNFEEDTFVIYHKYYLNDSFHKLKI